MYFILRVPKFKACDFRWEQLHGFSFKSLKYICNCPCQISGHGVWSTCRFRLLLLHIKGFDTRSCILIDIDCYGKTPVQVRNIHVEIVALLRLILMWRHCQWRTRQNNKYMCPEDANKFSLMDSLEWRKKKCKNIATFIRFRMLW